ncbi:hypothetical protein EYF80_020510 [Liparis tanakae]|uniref:Uncharacterized protein n=1 Tax=Liparis tanakae TaxID=230148 RepID=A0A4Z2HW49_9TELE|nr:hypothetical protein EYF80_020510 [Liparis tanakae]
MCGPHSTALTKYGSALREREKRKRKRRSAVVASDPEKQLSRLLPTRRIDPGTPLSDADAAAADAAAAAAAARGVGRLSTITSSADREAKPARNNNGRIAGKRGTGNPPDNTDEYVAGRKSTTPR